MRRLLPRDVGVKTVSDVIAIVVPVFVLIGLGFAAGWFGVLSHQAGEGLSDFVFTFCIPPLIFRTMATATMPETQPWGYWLAYFSGVAIVWALTMLLARRSFGAGHGQSVIAGFCASQSNTVLVGIPLLLSAYGEAGRVPLFLLIAVHLPIMVTAATLLIEGRRGVNLVNLARRLFLNPILLGIFFGLAWRGTGWELGGPLKSVLDQLAAAAIPCALVAMGLALRRYGLHSDLRLSLAVTAMKLVVLPALVFIFATRLFAMPPVWAGIAVLFAAMPSGVNSYLLAGRYQIGVGLSSGTIALSTGLSLLSTPFWLWMMGVGKI